MFFKKYIYFLFLLVFIVFFPVITYAQINYTALEGETFEFTITSLEKDMIEDAKDNKFDKYNLLEASLIASKIEDRNFINGMIKKIDVLISLIVSNPNYKKMSKEDISKLVLTELHNNIFRVYVANESTTLETLRSGRFNCVSSSLIYNFVVGELGIKSYGVIAPSHAFSAVSINEELIEVQTTSINGFAPDSNLIKEFEKLTGFKYVSLREKDKENMYIVENTQLLATLYSNMAVDLAKKQKKFNEALSYNIKSIMLFPEFKEAHSNIISILLSWLQHLTDKDKNYDSSINFNKKCLKVFPDTKELKQSYIYTYSKYAEYLSIKKQYPIAIKILEEGKQYLSDYNNSFDELIIVTYNNYILYLDKNAKYEKAFEVLEEAMLKYPNEKNINELKINLYYNFAILLSSKGDFKCIELLNQALIEFPDNNQLIQAKVNAYKNLWSYNMKLNDFDTSFSILNEALKNSNLGDSEYSKLLKDTYLTKISKLIKDKDFESSFALLKEIYSKFKNDKDVINTTRYLLQEYINILSKNKIKYEDALKLLSDLLKDNTQNKTYSNLIKEYIQAYVNDFIQKLMQKNKMEEALEKIDYAEGKFDNLDFEKIYAHVFLHIIKNKIENESYQEGLNYLISCKKYSDNTKIKNQVYNFVYNDALKKNKLSEALIFFEKVFEEYDNTNDALKEIILSIYSENIKRNIQNIYVKNLAFDTDKRNIKIQELEDLIYKALSFFKKYKLNTELAKLYIIISVEYYRVNKIDMALKYSLEGYLKYKDNEILKNNTIAFFIERAKELVKINKEEKKPYEAAMELLQEALQYFDEEDQTLLKQLLTQYIEESKK